MSAPIEFVMLLGQQRYSHDFFRKAEAEVRKELPSFRLHVFEEYDTERRPDEVEAAIARCSCLFTSLIILGETSEWLVPVVERHDPPVVFCFESLPEIMRLTKVGSYGFKGGKGMPKPVQNVARLLVGGREEDALYGYVKLQQITSKLIKFLPGKKMGDFRNWSTVQSYWSNRDVANAANMFKLILQEYLGQSKLRIVAPREMPPMGFAHPDAPKLFATPEEFERWERGRWEHRTENRKLRTTEPGNYGTKLTQQRVQGTEGRAQRTERGGAREEEQGLPIGTVAVLSFRAHILTGTQYHNEVVRALEAQGLRVIPLFCMGIETHIAVREWLPKLGVDLVINTMGFPLVGGRRVRQKLEGRPRFHENC
ncbi:DUF3479 domain-containing protein [Candidatus Gracilibacteria bacterium]|nr:DUF3479 domain-containing protein [Candidatus Gracilibacteria bacterium]